MDRLNPAQQDAVREPEHLALISCPGSGKTRVIVSKLLALLEEYADSPRRIGCITHTNAAVYEIEHRVRQEAQADEARAYRVLTIHSFCLTHILGPYRYLLPEFVDGLEIVTAETPWLEAVSDQLNEAFACRCSPDDWANVCRTEDGSLRPGSVPSAAAAHFLKNLDAAGRSTMSDIVYHSVRLLRENSFIGHSLASTYAWLLVDECQDTSDTQMAVLRAIACHGRTRFLLVGDPEQSIYRFSGAAPHLMIEFARELSARTDLQLSGNYRSSQHIVAASERLSPRDPRMEAVGERADDPFEPRYVHASSMVSAICDHFLPALAELEIPVGRAAILAPQVFPLFTIARTLRSLGVPVIGPGARPYKRSLEFAAFTEQVCAFLEERSGYAANQAERALSLMLQQLNGEVDAATSPFDAKKILYRLLHAARECRNHAAAAVPFLRSFGESVTAILSDAEALRKGVASRITDAVETMIRSIEERLGEEAARLSTADLALFARPSECLELMTIHYAKGREFDAVAVIDLLDGVLPHWRDRDQDAIDDSRRRLYVAMTRARRVLFLFSHHHQRNLPSRFLGPRWLGFSRR